MNLQNLLVYHKSLVDLLEKIDEMGGAYDLLPEGYKIVIDGKAIYPAFQFVDNDEVQKAIRYVANHYALLGDQSGLGMFSFLILNWDSIKSGDPIKIANVLNQLKM
ncbi:hypothetical protein EK546_09090 [Salmonella enterica]|nr:hypothetical protein [Salmonella enterica]